MPGWLPENRGLVLFPRGLLFGLSAIERIILRIQALSNRFFFIAILFQNNPNNAKSSQLKNKLDIAEKKWYIFLIN